MGPHGAAKNHLLRLAQPLFWLLDELSPELESAARLDALKSDTRIRLAAFKQACQAASLKADAIEAVHYCFCAALDQAGSRVRGRANRLRGVWLQHGLVAEFYGERSYGERCRSWITKLQETPNASENALEVIGQLMERGLRDERGMPLPKAWPVHGHTQVTTVTPAAARQGALLGEAVPDRQHKFRLIIGPLDLQQYLNFTPKGRDLPVLVEWVRSFVGFEFEWEVELQVQPQSAPPAVLGADERLGWSTWLGRSDTSCAITGMVFQPEHYVAQ